MFGDVRLACSCSAIVAMVSSYYSTTLEFSEPFSMTHFLLFFENADCMTRCLILYTCGNGTEWQCICQQQIKHNCFYPAGHCLFIFTYLQISSQTWIKTPRRLSGFWHHMPDCSRPPLSCCGQIPPNRQIKEWGWALKKDGSHSTVTVNSKTQR